MELAIYSIMEQVDRRKHEKISFLIFVVCNFLQAANNAAAEGNSFGSQLNNYFKSNADAAINSLTNGGEIRTVDGKQKANVQMACDESKSGGIFEYRLHRYK